MPWNKGERRSVPTDKIPFWHWILMIIIAGFIATLGALVSYGVLVHKGWLSPKQKVVMADKNMSVVEFKTREVPRRHQTYVVSVVTSTHTDDGKRGIFPTNPECPNIMVIDGDFDIPREKVDKLKQSLRNIKGVTDIEVYPLKMIINKKCSPQGFKQIVTWEKIWPDIEKALP
jgi:hypothetical protein